MSSPSIQRQSILSTFAIVTGFALGGLNLVVLYPRLMSGEQFGLTRVVNDFGVIAANFATLGVLPVLYKFFPLYRRYLKPGENDLPVITGAVFAAGIAITILLLWLFQPAIIRAFGRNNPIFPGYYWVLIPFTILYALFLFAEPFAWYAGKSVLSNVLKETVFRALTLLFLLALGLGWVGFDGFMALFGVMFLIPAAWLLWVVYRRGMLQGTWRLSRVTRRLGWKMARFSSFIFLTTVVSITAILCDTLFLAGRNGFAMAAVFAIAQYASNLLEVPLRSMTGSAIPVLAEYWRAGNMTGVASIYRKSCINLLVAGMAIGGLLLINVPNLIRFLPAEYAALGLPILLLVIGRWINLAGGLNAQIIQTSKYLTFDYAANLLLSLAAIVLNYLMIRQFGLLGAAMANLIVWSAYNVIRYVYLLRKFGLQPLGRANLEVFILGCLLIAGIYWIPRSQNLYIDAAWRSLLFAGLFGALVLLRGYSDEVNWLWEKWRPGGRRWKQ